MTSTKARPVLLLVGTLLAMGLAGGQGRAATIHVPGDAPTIQGGIDLAQPGDDVLVGPGSYYESNITLKGGVWVHSEQGPTHTIVDAGNMGRVFDCMGQEEMVTLEGFWIARGHATGGDEVTGSGGGVRSFDSNLTVSNCVINDCTAAVLGAGIFAWNSGLEVRDCRVTQCTAGGPAGGIAAYCFDSPVRIINCDVSQNRADSVAGIGVWAPDMEIMGCRVQDNSSGWGCCGGLSVRGGVFRIEDCLVTDNFALTGDPGGDQLSFFECSGVVSGSTIHDWGGMTFQLWFGVSVVRFERTTLSSYYGGILDCDSNPAVEWRCCNLYAPEGGGEVCGTDLGGNFSANPLFCDAANGDYTLDWASPCLPGNHPNGVECGLIGALGAGCGTPPVTGACCFADDSCVVTEREDCASQGGTYLGDDTDCDPNPCVPTTTEKTTWGRIRAGYR